MSKDELKRYLDDLIKLNTVNTSSYEELGLVIELLLAYVNDWEIRLKVEQCLKLSHKL